MISALFLTACLLSGDTHSYNLATQQWMNFDHAWYDPVGNQAPAGGYSKTLYLDPPTSTPTSITIRGVATHTYRTIWENRSDHTVSPYITWNGTQFLDAKQRIDHELFGCFGSRAADFEEIAAPNHSSFIYFDRAPYMPPQQLNAYDGTPLIDWVNHTWACGLDSWVYQCLGTVPVCQQSQCTGSEPPKVTEFTIDFAPLDEKHKAGWMGGLLVYYLPTTRTVGHSPFGDGITHEWFDWTDCRVNTTLTITYNYGASPFGAGSCEPLPNSTGQPCLIAQSGSSIVATGAPTGSYCVLLRAAFTAPAWPWFSGNLCLNVTGPGYGRTLVPNITDPGGTVAVPINLADYTEPDGTGAWVQLFYRDHVEGTSTANLSDLIQVEVGP
jgi:hypothetical protein